MKKYKSAVFDIIIIAALIFASVSLIIYPEVAVEAAKCGVDMCFYVVIPSLFPFFVLASLSSKLGISQKAGRLCAPVMKPLFSLGGDCAVPLVLGLIGGYPVGTKAAVELYKSGRCTKNEAERLISFCNNSGPAFVFSIVGAGIFGSAAAGAVIYAIHILSSLLTGVLSSRIFKKHSLRSARDSVMILGEKTGFANAFISSVTSSFSSMLNISGFVVFFAVCISILEHTGIIPMLARTIAKTLPFDSGLIKSILYGCLEMTSGVCSLSLKSLSVPAAAAAASFLISWAGLSIHCQVLSVLADTDLSASMFFIGKALHGIISALITYFAFSSMTMFSDIAASSFAPLPFSYSAEYIKPAVYVFLTLFCLLFIKSQREKRYGKHRRNDV